MQRPAAAAVRGSRSSVAAAAAGIGACRRSLLPQPLVMTSVGQLPATTASPATDTDADGDNHDDNDYYDDATGDDRSEDDDPV